MENNTENYNNEIVFAIDSAIKAEDDLLTKSFNEIIALPLPEERYDVPEKEIAMQLKSPPEKKLKAG
jgi:hypothetical protein